MTNKELQIKETGEVIKAALNNGSLQQLSQLVANQLPARSDGSFPAHNSITFEELYATVFNAVGKAIKS
ncbi:MULTISPECIES: hypothetical protein [Pectobacterium]|uniref:hypothetical protein n=1 Tax=Pectobacterium TaxID=122277 RepID=UPI00102E53C2|nr:MULTISPECIES: hypothetical protein [Pectobacterium]MBB1525656.1 hypothetical protein [Pectobacterium carotovorum subsp. carotovorum]MCA6964736.1 hypothetical protein [Pectobacterium carotovorum]MCH4987166.1 hypothetical protein [Pectobacterium carotovorum]TAI86902.1 hypothetical protein EG330_05860 [Pectobacterium versatile]UFT92955.1 hypothetical protein LQF52_13910 [Pectobacterium carotovorum]